VSNGSLRSLRCSPGSRRLRRIRRNDHVGGSAPFRRVSSAPPADRRREHRGADRALSPPTSSSIADEKRVGSLRMHCSLRSLRLAPSSRCLPHSLADERRICSLARPGQRRASLAQHGGARSVLNRLLRRQRPESWRRRRSSRNDGLRFARSAFERVSLIAPPITSGGAYRRSQRVLVIGPIDAAVRWRGLPDAVRHAGWLPRSRSG
jgi:hypothetical protein